MLTRSQLAALEQRLLEERQAATRTVRELGREIESKAETERDAALRNSREVTQEESVSIVQLHTERLWLIDDALNRLRETPEIFHVSVVSGLTIPFERLESVPWTRVREGETEPPREPGGVQDVPYARESPSAASSQEESRAGT